MSLTWTLRDTAPDPPGPCALHQHPRYGAAMRAIGADVGWYALTCGARTLGTAQLLRRRLGPLRLTWLPRGPVLAPDADPDAALLPLPGPSIVQPDTPGTARLYRSHGYRALLTPAHVAELDLTPDPGTLFTGLHGKWRNRLRAAQSGPLRTHDRPFDPDRDADLLTLDRHQQRARGYRALPPGFTLAFAATHRQATRLFTAHDRAGMLAYLLFLLHGQTATYHIGWATPAARRTHAHTLLMWQAITHLADRGVTRLDLGPIDTETAPGLARFKLGTGATSRPLGPTLLRLLPHRGATIAA
ncbi:GNAT family N-acetyltransferase [Roseovarius atlanticus]|uniref:GNAT family N-acetyltransferase n=1 Tax=Roseovarius atlanticus TaxID=1641875 RepID=UPI001C96D97A|nr:GNAT family N-acetyltransferase [Roseovarius atlanticus]MBY5988685.1 GNAT family N-acetyltransferase [Roseovarius atlanticus]MBY6124076.1 GNAT family N-acetyltransferase [Roseovarius atlanticus]MBY6148571.1 GNAT family N-acetyltransferase [Roseovarius atlanticus]